MVPLAAIEEKDEEEEEEENKGSSNRPEHLIEVVFRGDCGASAGI